MAKQEFEPVYRVLACAIRFAEVVRSRAPRRDELEAQAALLAAVAALLQSTTTRRSREPP